MKEKLIVPTNSDQLLEITNSMTEYFSKKNWMHMTDYIELVNKILKKDETIRKQDTVGDKRA